MLCTLLFCAAALSFLDRQVLSVLAPQLMPELRMTNTEYSRVVFAFVLSYTIMFSLGGRLMDVVGTRLGLSFSVGLWSLASASHAIASGPWSLGAARLMLGVGEGACFPAVTKGAIEWIPPEHRSLAIGFANGGSSLAIGSVVDNFSFTPVFLVSAVLYPASWLILAGGFLKRWVAAAPTHHFALGVGHRANALRRIADILGIESVVITGDNRP